ncbi:MAG: sarcosine oxidase subunit gamma SoxG [Thermodesulfobacteriota bacterium]|nr:sarcosine oxidase subunit gamma SoxG [Thermodesulfobacteriota bacterium]
MAVFQRNSPVEFSVHPVKTTKREEWEVVLEYKGEGEGPHLVDLSHRKRWDVQNSDLSTIQPGGMNIPETPGRCTFQNGLLIARMNLTQTHVWHIFGDNLEIQTTSAFTDVTESSVFLALMGHDIFLITEKLTSMDLLDPEKKPLFLLQGPFSHVASQLVVMEREKNSGIILFSCSRGYAQDMINAILDAGEEFGLRPSGENSFTSRFENR